MKVAVIGAGAMGTLFAGLLAMVKNPDDEVFLITNQSGPSTEANSIMIEPSQKVRQELAVFAQGALVEDKMRIVSNPLDAKGCRLAIILVKSYRSFEAGQQAAALMDPAGGGVVLSLQNGLGNVEAFASVSTLAGHSLTQGVTTIGAYLAGPGQVKFNGAGVTTLPVLPEAEGNRTLEWLGDKLSRIGLTVNFSAEVASLIWGKLVINCACNALTALLDLTNGALLTNLPAWEIARQAGSEVAELARLKGIPLPYPYEEVDDAIRRVLELNLYNHSSMWQSVKKGRPTEIEALNGAVVSEAAKLGFATPTSQLLAQLVRALEARASLHGG